MNYRVGKFALTTFNLGNPSGNQGNFYMDFSLPNLFNEGDSWDRIDKYYKVEKCEEQIVNGVNFPDCIKVSIEAIKGSNPYVLGTGYYILARDVGIIKLVFNRLDGTTCSFENLTNRQFGESDCSAIFNSIKLY